MNLEAAAELLQEDGYHVVGCLNGRDALQAFAHSIPGTFGLVLADVEMPGMDGEMLAEKIRELPHADSLKVPIVGMYIPMPWKGQTGEKRSQVCWESRLIVRRSAA